MRRPDKEDRAVCDSSTNRRRIYNGYAAFHDPMVIVLLISALNRGPTLFDIVGGEIPTRMSYALFLLTTLAAPAVVFAGDENLKQEVEKIGSAYAESFNRRDAAGIATLNASGGIHVNPGGPRSDIAEFYQGAFKAGFNHEEISVEEVWPLGPDTVLAIGKYRITGTNQSGVAIETGGVRRIADRAWGAPGAKHVALTTADQGGSRKSNRNHRIARMSSCRGPRSASMISHCLGWVCQRS
jgi:ketosteroid isomerase-like protein